MVFTENSKISVANLLCKIFRTVWEFQDISVTQILREIKFREFRSFQSAFFANLGALNFVDSAKYKKKSKFRASQSVKIADFAL